MTTEAMNEEQAAERLAALLKEVDAVISNMIKDQADEWLGDMIDELETRREALGEDKAEAEDEEE